MTHTQGKRQAAEIVWERDQMLDSTDKDFKVAIKNTFKELTETMIKEVTKGMMSTSHTIETINR